MIDFADISIWLHLVIKFPDSIFVAGDPGDVCVSGAQDDFAWTFGFASVAQWLHRGNATSEKQAIYYENINYSAQYAGLE